VRERRGRRRRSACRARKRMMAQLDLFRSNLVAAQFLGRAMTSAHGEARYDGNSDIFDEQLSLD
jgi:hypothetical protein